MKCKFKSASVPWNCLALSFAKEGDSGWACLGVIKQMQSNGLAIRVHPGLTMWNYFNELKGVGMVNSLCCLTA